MTGLRPSGIGHHRSAWRQGIHSLESAVPRPSQPPAPEAGEQDLSHEALAVPPSHGRQAAPEEVDSESGASAQLGESHQGPEAHPPVAPAGFLTEGVQAAHPHPGPSSLEPPLTDEAESATSELARAPAAPAPGQARETRAARATAAARPATVPASASALRQATSAASPSPSPSFILQDCSGPFQPLLKVSRPIPVGAVDGRYAVLLRRAAPSQSYGLTFLADEGLEKDLQSVSVAEDLPHLGVRKGDTVLMVNNRVPRSSRECLGLLREATSLLLVLQTSSQEAAKTAHQGINNAAGDVDSLMQVPLAVVPPVILDLSEGEFLVTVRRSSLRQKFGINFSFEEWRRRAWKAGTLRHNTDAEQRQAARWMRGAPIVVAGDAPHLGLCKGDLLLTVNGCQPQSEAGFQFIFERSRILKLTLLRSPDKLADMMALPLLDLDSDEVGGGWLESSNVIGTDGTGGAQEDFCSIELSSHGVQARDCNYPWQFCLHSCSGAHGDKVESEMEIVGWDGMGGEVKAFVSRPRPLGAGRLKPTRPRAPHAEASIPQPEGQRILKPFWSL